MPVTIMTILSFLTTWLTCVACGYGRDGAALYLFDGLCHGFNLDSSKSMHRPQLWPRTVGPKPK